MSVNQASPVPSKAQTFWKDPIFWFVVSIVFVWGAVFNFLPVSFPVFKRIFGSTLEQMGRSQLLFFISALVISVVGGWFVGRVGLRHAAIATLLGFAVALIIIGSAPSFSIVLMGAFCFGLASAAVVIVYSTIVSERFGDKRQSVFAIVGIADGIGATVGPGALGWWLGHVERTGGNWRTGYYVAAGVIGALIVWALLLRKDAIPSEAGQTTSGSAALSAMKDILSKPTIYGVGLLVFLHGLAQVGMVSFVGQLYQKKLQIDAARAAYFISVNSAGFFVGRSILSWITARRKIPELLVLAICAAGGSLAFVATIASPSYFSGLVMFTLAGVFISGDGPSIASYVGMRFASQVATAFALMGGLGNIGGGAGPYLVGFVGNRLGLETGIWFMPVFSLGLSAMAFLWYLRERARPSQTT